MFDANPAPDLPATLMAGFREVFRGSDPVRFVRAPGRVNLIGEHTDYNEGFVLPIAIDPAMHVAAGYRSDARVVTHSREFGQTYDLDLTAAPTPTPSGWAAYVVGVIALLADHGARVPGANLYLASDVPPGGGLSSSAALEVGVALAILSLGGLEWDPRQVADVCREAEQLFAGTPCGIMDQYASLLSREGHALLIDCRSREAEPVPFPSDELAIVVIDTQVRHELAAGEYARRVEACRAGVAHFSHGRPDIRSLRDVTLANLMRHSDGLDPVVVKRCRHVVEENMRVHEFVGALRTRHFARVGAAMYASHASLRDLYEVSCEELDGVVETVRHVPGVIGARMTGGGFGGCVVALTRHEAIGMVQTALAREYDPRHAKPANMRLTRPSAGASVQ